MIRTRNQKWQWTNAAASVVPNVDYWDLTANGAVRVRNFYLRALRVLVQEGGTDWRLKDFVRHAREANHKLIQLRRRGR